MSISLEQYNHLVETLYEAGLDPNRWQTFCDRLGDVLGEGAIAMVQGHDLRTHTSLGAFTASYVPLISRERLDYYAKINPWLPPLRSVPAGEIVTDLDLVPREELVKTEFWADWIRHLGDVSAGVGSILFRENDRFVFFTCNYDWQRQDELRNTINRMWTLLTPHAQRACRMYRSLEGQRLVDRRYREALDKVGKPVFLLEFSGPFEPPQWCRRKAPS